jgi:membrane-associated phospholipid phosphatase
VDGLYEIEIWIILALQSLGSWLVVPMRALSMLGQEEFYLLLMPTLYWCFSAALGLRVALMLLLSNAASSALKIAFHSARPYWFDPRVQGLAAESTFGAPSGHASNGIAVWGMLATAFQSRRARAGLTVLIILIGFSRVYLGVHFVSDVLAGWLLGGVLLLAYLKIEAPILRWIRTLTLSRKILAALLSSLVLAGLILTAPVLAGGWEIPGAWEQNALTAVPGSEFDPFNIEGAFTTAGTWFGMLAGIAWLYHLQGSLWNADGTPLQRILRYVVGAVGLMIFWFVLGQVFPRDSNLLSYSLRFARYTLIGLWVSALAPLLFQRIGLAVPPQLSSKPALSSQ